VASASRVVVVFPVETAPKNRGSSSPREGSSPNQIKMNPRSNPTTLRDRVPAAHDKEPKSPINRAASRRIFSQIQAQTLVCHLAHRPATAGRPLLNWCPIDHLRPPPPLFDRSPMTSDPWSLHPPSSKAKA
jgi:hypothetical protein